MRLGFYSNRWIVIFHNCCKLLSTSTSRYTLPHLRISASPGHLYSFLLLLRSPRLFCLTVLYTSICITQVSVYPSGIHRSHPHIKSIRPRGTPHVLHEPQQGPCHANADTLIYSLAPHSVRSTSSFPCSGAVGNETVGQRPAFPFSLISFLHSMSNSRSTATGTATAETFCNTFYRIAA